MRLSRIGSIGSVGGRWCSKQCGGNMPDKLTSARYTVKRKGAHTGSDCCFEAQWRTAEPNSTASQPENKPAYNTDDQIGHYYEGLMVANTRNSAHARTAVSCASVYILATRPAVVECYGLVYTTTGSFLRYLMQPGIFCLYQKNSHDGQNSNRGPCDYSSTTL